MPYRKSYKPYRRNYGSNKKKWASFMKEIPNAVINIATGTNGGAWVPLVSNSVETATPTPTIVKAKHLKCIFDIFATAGKLINGAVYLIYVPQGYTPSIDLPIQHPEWIMAWRGLDVDTYTEPGGSKQVQMSSSMARNLNSGDAIYLLFHLTNTPNGLVAPVNYHGRFSCVVRNN